MELEAEVAKLKEENEELQKKQVILAIATCDIQMQALTCTWIYSLSSLTWNFSLIDIYLGTAGRNYGNSEKSSKLGLCFVSFLYSIPFAPFYFSSVIAKYLRWS